MTMNSLEGKVAVVTGGAQGIGYAITKILANHGAKVVFADVDGEASAKVEQELGSSAKAHVGDLLDPEVPKALIDTAVDAFGGVDIVVNNAGYHWDAMFHKMSEKQWQAMLDIHMTVPFRVLQAAAPVMFAAATEDAKAGREVMRKVVNVSSLAASFGNIGASNYSAAKAGMIGLTKSLAKEWGPRKICVNSAAFGVIQTRLGLPQSEQNQIKVGGEEVSLGVPVKTLHAMGIDHETETGDIYKPREIKQIPLGRAGPIDEAAGLVYFLCSPLSDYVTGQVMSASGGSGGGMS
jgi:3-oxoacyl-[acyl-carrier protein] reductase